jgi:hypothetical protein
VAAPKGIQSIPHCWDYLDNQPARDGQVGIAASVAPVGSAGGAGGVRGIGCFEHIALAQKLEQKLQND